MSTILVVEDTQDNFDLIVDAFEDVYELEHAQTGEEGVVKAKTLKPDLILLDISLPELDGWKVARRLRGDPEVADIPVIAITAHAMNGDLDKCLEAGCDDYLAKPINIRDLMELVAEFLVTVDPVES
ncbi:MAG: response regulator [Planctomycetota bacterium]|jgi:CheY-like chemotaxis protein